MNKGVSGIYALTDPDGAIRYVGQAKCIRKRYGEHCRVSNNLGNTHRERWLSGLLEAGEKPGLVVLAITEGRDPAEQAWIQLLRGIHRLTNIADGGRSMRHAERAKEEMPWGKGYSPYRKVMMMLRCNARSLRQRGEFDRARRITDKADHISRRAKVIRARGRDSWLDFNERIAAVHRG